MTRKGRIFTDYASRIKNQWASVLSAVRRPVSFVFYFLAAFTAHAQFTETPLGTRATEAPTVRALRTEALGLPFFDDFSTIRNGIPDPALWQAGGGAVVNNTLAVNHPSVNVVTLDGLNRTGQPYNPTDPFAQGPADSLTSQPVDLSALTPSDSVYLSFFWQPRGLGEQPDQDDSLQVDFRDANGTWQPVWWQRGGLTNGAQFTQVLVPVLRSVFFHGNFQFRFRQFAKGSGAFDTWHVDYVYLNRGRRASERFFKDVAVRSQPTPYLRRYRAMPLTQYLKNPAGETADTVRTDIVNLFNNNNFTTLRFNVRELTTGQTVQQFTQAVSENIPANSSQVKTVKTTPLSGFSGRSAVLRYTFDVLTTDDQNPTIPGVNLKRNDTLSAHAVLADYYAHDDGSAEFAARINQRLGRVAVRFVLNQPDAVRAVRLFVAPYPPLPNAANVTLQLLGNANGRPGQILGGSAFSSRAAKPVGGGFTEFTLANAVAVRDTFYVAWLQLTDDALSVGLDKNTDFSQQIFYNLGNEWVANTGTDALRGSFMVRPVMGGQPDGVVTGREPESTASFAVFPNPTNGPLRWNDAGFETLEIFNASGQSVRKFAVGGQTEADVSTLPPGLYLLKFSDETRAVTRRLIVTQ